MYRILIGFQMVIAPVQVGIAVTLTQPDWNHRHGVEVVLKIALVLMLATGFSFYQVSRRTAALRSRAWFRWAYLLPLLAIGVHRITIGMAVEPEWQAFRTAYQNRADRPPTHVGRWSISEVPAAPNVSTRDTRRAMQKLVMASLRIWTIDFLRVQSSTPGWAYLGSLIVAVCYRPCSEPKR